MAKKDFSYRGFTVEELQAKSMDEVSALMTSRVRRSLKRGLTEMQKKLIARVKTTRKNVEAGKKVKPIRTHCRNMPILPEMVGLDFEVYNGKEYTRVTIDPEMIGQFLGDFSYTARPVRHNAPGVGATRSSLFVPLK